MVTTRDLFLQTCCSHTPDLTPTEPARLVVHLRIHPIPYRTVPRKVGTGFHGTLAGNVYLSSKKVLDDIRVFKGMEPAPAEEDEEDQDEDEGEGEAASPQVRRPCV